MPPPKAVEKFGSSAEFVGDFEDDGVRFQGMAGQKECRFHGGPDGSGMGETHRLPCILSGETESGSAGEQPGKG
jgi:hypothetical protein